MGIEGGQCPGGASHQKARETSIGVEALYLVGSTNGKQDHLNICGQWLAFIQRCVCLHLVAYASALR